MSFENHKTKGANKSSVWYYFLTDTTGISRAKCKICNKILKTNGGSTKGLLTHLGVLMSTNPQYKTTKRYHRRTSS
ncbi:uncharacterized protein LOC124420735 isoform X3 [Lucilia cuprina]|uniref:uncharacterized protein LOC124420735 isoform X3 n=1 Tax=Lucilia cuprina TaxID=7375 RepID=UPI001F052BD5|nr:uncharacterized protein LOC124420735 isoform X3 [Lucilia cuprina]